MTLVDNSNPLKYHEVNIKLICARNSTSHIKNDLYINKNHLLIIELPVDNRKACQYEKQNRPVLASNQR